MRLMDWIAPIVWIPAAASAQPAGPAPEVAAPDLARVIAAEPLREDLDQLRALLEREWILANLTDDDCEAAIDALARDAEKGVTLAELTFRLQRVLAMGRDRHAGVAELPSALHTIPGVRPQFVVDLSGDDYVAMAEIRDSLASVNPGYKHRYRPLKEGYPYITAIDGRPMADWVRAASPYVSGGPARAIRWRAMFLLLELPFLRRELGLPNEPHIRVRLMSTDRESEVELDAPTGPYQRFHLQVPRPGWRVIDGSMGYIWMPDTFSVGTGAVVEGMANLRGTKGLILDIRGNTGGNLEPLLVLACHLMRPEQPRQVVGRIVHWEGAFPTEGTPGMAGWLSPESPALSAEGKAVMTAFRIPNGGWKPSSSRPAESRPVFFCRREAEPGLAVFGHERFPKTYDYPGPVVVLFDHRTFSGGELFMAALKELAGATLVGAETSAGGGGSPKWHKLKNSGLQVMLSGIVFVRADGSLIDGQGIHPDVRVEPEPGFYLGTSDRMLEKAIEVLKARIADRR